LQIVKVQYELQIPRSAAKNSQSLSHCHRLATEAQ
jgi:hypothetical protein